MGTMHSPPSVPQISFFRCIPWRQFFYPASATATTTITAEATTTTAAVTTITAAARTMTTAAATTTTTEAAATTTTTAAAATTTREGPISTAPHYLSSMANFLVDSLEFSEEEALSTSTKLTKLRQSRGVTNLCDPKFYRNADLAISFLQQKGLEKPHIKKVVHSAPQILACRIKETLEPKMNYFQELGFSVSDFADIIKAQPGILYYSLDSTIRPAVEALREIMGSNENVVRVLKGFKLNALPLVTKHLVPNVSLLQSLGIPIESIQKCILQLFATFIRKPEVFKDRIAVAEAKWGVSPRSTMFLSAVLLLCRLNEENIESKFRLFESFGWDRSHVVTLFQRNPHFLGLSERNIKAKLRFFMNELGYEVSSLIAKAAMLCYSLEKRVLPRHLVLQLLKGKGLIGENFPFYCALLMTEDRFLRTWIRPFEDDVPNLHGIYVNSRGSSAQQQIKRGKNKPFKTRRLKPDSA